MLKNMKISSRLILSMLLLGLLPMIIIAVIAFFTSSSSLENEAVHKLDAVKNIKQKQIDDYFKKKKAELDVYAKNSAVRQACERFIKAYNETGLNSDIWNKWDEFHGGKLKQFTDKMGFYDLFFISMNGDVAFTAAKEADLGKNVVSGELANSPLGELFNKAKTGFAFQDYSWYDISSEPAAFIGRPINDLEGNQIGIIALQLSLTAINDIMQERTGMGETGETYLVGTNKRMRSDSYLDPEGHSVKASFAGTVKENGVDTKAANEAISGNSDTEVIIDYNGNPVYSSYSPLEVYGKRWALIAEIDEAELMEPVNNLLMYMIIIALIAAAVVVVTALFLSNSINKGIKKVISQIGDLVKAVTDGKLDKRADSEDVGVDFKDVMNNLNELIDAFVQPINVTAEYVDRISKGDIPPKIEDEYKGDFNEIKNNLNVCIGAINELVSDGIALTDAAAEGKLDIRADASKHGGDFRKIVEGFNDTLDNVIGPLNVTAEYVDRISKGDIPPKIEDEYKGDFNEIKNNLNVCIDAINELVRDSKMLSDAASEGKLDTRADASKHGGDFKGIVEGVNDTLDNVIGPLNVAAEYVDRISKGDIPPKIEDEYKGDFNEIKNNLNVCIDAINELVRDSKMLSDAASEGKLDTRADASKHGGDFKGIVEGVNDTLDNVIGPLNVAAEYVDRISKGDIPPKIEDEYKGDFNEIKNNLNVCIDSLNTLANELGDTIKKQNEGDIEARCNTEKVFGAYAELLKGINDALDSIANPVLEGIDIMKEYAEGDLSKEMRELPGKQMVLTNAINGIRNNLLQLVTDVNSLVESGKTGRLRKRADASKHGGDYQKIVKGVNDMLNAVVGFIDNMPIPAMAIDKDFNIVYLNDTGAKIGGKAGKDLEGTKCYDFFKTSDCQTGDCACHKAMQLNNIAESETDAHPTPDLDIEIKYSGIPIRDDDGKAIGAFEVVMDQTDIKNAMAKAEQMAKTQAEVLDEAGAALERLSSGDFTATMKGQYEGDNEKLKEFVNALSSALSDIISQVKDAVENTASSAAEISASSDNLASGAEEQSSQADEVASAVEEMSRTITENAMSATKTAENAEKYGKIAKEGGDVVEQTVQKMRDIASAVKNTASNIEKLGQSGKKIGEIISVIDDIADQTNLLALNAAIEAARAGEQGRGFAVVADEVRKLAERTTEATKQIADMIKGIQKETDNAVEEMQQGTTEVESGIELADKAGDSLGQVVSSSQEVQDMINQIAAANEEQSSTSEEIAKNVAGISNVTSEQAQQVQEVASTSDELAKLTEQLRDLVEQFTINEGDKSKMEMENYKLRSKEEKYLESPDEKA